MSLGRSGRRKRSKRERDHELPQQGSLRENLRVGPHEDRRDELDGSFNEKLELDASSLWNLLRGVH